MLTIDPPPRRRIGGIAARAEKRPGEVHGEHAVPLLERRLLDRGLVLDCRVVDEDVQPPWRSTAAEIRRSTCAGSQTSVGT
jgi:hypothetical protein